MIERLEARSGAVPELRSVHTHIEPLSRTDWASAPPADDGARSARRSRRPSAGSPARSPSVRFRDAERGRVALVTITLPGEQPLPSAHQHAGRIEEAVRERCPGGRDRPHGAVIVHSRPRPTGARAERAARVPGAPAHG